MNAVEMNAMKLIWPSVLGPMNGLEMDVVMIDDSTRKEEERTLLSLN